MEPKRAKCEFVSLFVSLFVCEFMVHRAACAAKNINTFGGIFHRGLTPLPPSVENSSNRKIDI